MLIAWNSNPPLRAWSAATPAQSLITLHRPASEPVIFPELMGFLRVPGAAGWRVGSPTFPRHGNRKELRLHGKIARAAAMDSKVEANFWRNR
jgi:hypothetical protein